jgi:LmbE family N-acetylglucosaminyl deacetylase
LATQSGGPWDTDAPRLHPLRVDLEEMADQLTLMAVHAHPDDECSSTGGVLARYASEGIQTVVVTCTNGELGDLPGGIKPGDPGHDEAAVAALRRRELEAACRLLGVTHLELLGYQDSGMADWAFKDRPRAFCNIPTDVAAARVAELIERYRPDVVVTYDDSAAYDHPDHVKTSEVTRAALLLTTVPKKFYFTAISRRNWDKIRTVLEEEGGEAELPTLSPDMEQKLDELEARIQTTVDVLPFAATKRAALAAHASQLEGSFFTKFPPDVFDLAFGQETFIRVADSTGAPLPETDLFAGLR